MASSTAPSLSIPRTGLTLVEPCSNGLDGPAASPSQRWVNVVFVHGLNGHPRHTWESKEQVDSFLTRLPRWLQGLSGNKAVPALESDLQESQTGAGDFWPGDRLVRGVPQARVWTYGYDAGVMSFFTGASKNSITHHGQDLMVKLERGLQNKDPIIFVAHSLGGLVVKWAMRRMRSDRVTKYMECLSRIHAVVFCGTPHRGSSWAKLASQFVAVAIMDANPRLLRNLEVDAEILNLIQRDFLSLVDEFPITVHSFLEGRAMTGVRGFNSKIVDDFSAEVGCKNETVETINGNHRTMVRGEGADEICAVIRVLVQDSVLRASQAPQNTLEDSSPVDSSFDLEYDRQVQVITEKCILGSLEFPTMNDRYSGIETAHRSAFHAHKSTFDWIFDRRGPGFVDWLQKGDGVFWINGKAGSGKSTLMKFIADDARLNSYLNDSQTGLRPVVRVDFYFWVGGSSDQRALSGFLRTFLYRILSQAGDLIPAVFPEKWAHLRSAVSEGLSKLQAQEMERMAKELQEMKEGKDALVNELPTSKERMKILANELHELKQWAGYRVKQIKREIMERKALATPVQNEITERKTLVEQIQLGFRGGETRVQQLQKEIEEREKLDGQIHGEIREREKLIEKSENEIKERERLLKQAQERIEEKERSIGRIQKEIRRRDGAWMAETAYQRAGGKIIDQLSGDERRTQDDLLQRFHDTLAKLSSLYTLFLLVDGLDEYEATEEEMENLVNLLKNAGKNPNSRICVSTRPYAVFETHFGRAKFPSLRLQDLTFGDIRMFVKDAFDQSSLMETARNTNPSDMPDFYSIIVRKAEGVFLWVRLVVKMLLRGLKNGEEFLELQRMVERLPEDLERLYRHMFDSIETKYWVRSSKIFSIVNAAQEPPSALAIWYSGDSDANPLESLSEKTKAARCYWVYLRLMSQCAGLLELRRSNMFYDHDNDEESDDDDCDPGDGLMDDDLLQPLDFSLQQQYYVGSTVHYMHRTTKDFITSAEMKDLIRSRLDNGTQGTPFDPHKWLALQTLIKLRHFMATKPSLENEDLDFDFGNNATLQFHSDRTLQQISYLRNMVDMYGARCMSEAIATRLKVVSEELCNCSRPEDPEGMTESEARPSKRSALQGLGLPVEAEWPRRGSSDLYCLEPPPTERTTNNLFDEELRSLLQEEGVNFGRKLPLRRR